MHNIRILRYSSTMLQQLTVKNFALVEALDIEFASGLTVITGESGAGKSILLDALGLVLGGRATRTSIRPGAASCEVTADFDVGAHPAAMRYLTEQALVDDAEPSRCLVRRVATAAGRSRTFVNGTPVNLDVLQSLCAPLVDVHGQGEHRSLQSRAVQLALLDDYGVEPALTQTVRSAFDDWQIKSNELEELAARTQAARERMELLRYQAEELSALGLAAGEVEALEHKFKRLSGASDIQAVIGAHWAALDGELIPKLNRLAADLADIDDTLESLATSRQLVQSAQVNAEEALVELRAYLDSVPVDPGALAQVERRLEAIHDIARKHRISAVELLAHAAKIELELESLVIDEQRLEALHQDCAACEQHYRTCAAELSTARAAAADGFAADIGAAMAELGLKQASLTLEFNAAEGAHGLESVDYWVTTNPKYPAGLLKQIASGGELARISLAIQLVAAARSALPCLVLDEADVGIGGTTADVLGRMLRRLSKHTQVICVTHAPQVAALADTHLLVLKTTDQDTVIEALDLGDRIEELSRMLAGQRITKKTREYAETLLEGALS